ncbi:MAG: hypothetical protein DWQ34_09495 [Planctomycetota bacterium]|nr:MAG: hypothetical protein DWQ34_09495 [Planctomycetota bacterium]REJ95865.1 MAG: hypothetical protein DWQ29_01495 [Planctomycetota bacterium]REK20700.1 MAG: hypothetical protein DWQ41_23930 [Planctomycetota bacterium]REK38118.1 MAG: hypothetical protein DWQ45_05620 [Planctomycetota bacterium]
MMNRALTLAVLSLFLLPPLDANADHRHGRRHSGGVRRDPNWGWDGFNRLHYSPRYRSGRFGYNNFYGGYGGAAFYGGGFLWGAGYRYDPLITPSGFGYYSAPNIPPAYYGYGAYGVYGPAIDAPPGFSDLREPLQPALPGRQQMQEWLQEDREAWEAPLETLPVEELPKRFLRPSSDEAKRKSIRRQHEGDLQLAALQYTVAARRYRDAVGTAPDRAAPYFRLGIAETGRGEFDEAARNFKLGLQLDPDWPADPEQLSALLGEHNLLAKAQFTQRLLDWVKLDIRDPDRLFLLGVILYIDDDAERALEVFETAARLGGMKEYLAAFLMQTDTEVVAAPEEENATGDGVFVPPPPTPDTTLPEPDAENGPRLKAPAEPPLPAPPPNP